MSNDKKEKKYLCDSPQLIAEWNSEKNVDINIHNITCSSGKKVWWKCAKGHEWETTVSNRNIGNGCPYCSNNKVLKGYNDLVTINPEIAKEWHPTKNGTLTPIDVTRSSGKKVWWKCAKGHEWETTVSHRNIGNGCPYCSNKKVLKGYNDLATINPEIAKEWHPTKNGTLTPIDVTRSSGKKVWWKCVEGHEWEAIVSDKNREGGCPYCSNKKVLKGYNDLATINPELAKEWHSTKNETLTPRDITSGSDKKVWWQCAKGHEWEALVYSRNTGVCCPYCSGRKILQGFNDFESINPELAKEWHSTKNETLTPRDITRACNKKVWWQCAKGHEWEATVNNRNAGKGCPICKGEMQTSFPEQAICFYLRQVVPTENRAIVLGKEIDVYIPSWGIGIEYDGYIFHKSIESKEREIKKDNHFTQNNITIIRIKESNTNNIDYDKRIIYCVCDTRYKYMESMFKNLSKIIANINGYKICFDVNINRDRIAIMEQYIESEKANSLAIKSPEVANSWNHNKNGLITPDKISNSSNKKVWWVCEKGHEWETVVYHRNRGDGCPICSGRQILQGYNDLSTANSSIAKEWHSTKNGTLTPMDVTSNSSKKAWWQCAKGHEWESTVNNRNAGKGCPYCVGQKVSQGYNDLATINPELAKEWHSTKNRTLTPMDVTSSSNKKAWWQCAKGHEWESTVSNRNIGNGCPYCAGQKVSQGYNDLATINPELAKEWHSTKNGTLTPMDVTSSSNKKAWWKCAKGHEWESTVNTRNSGNGCPYCSGRNVIQGETDLATINPELAKEWHSTKNGTLTPMDVTSSSNKKAWWQCVKGHEWESTVNTRNSGKGCPYCVGQKVLKGYNDFATINSELTKEWHSTKNGTLTPMDVTSSSNKKVWWKCDKEHEWEAIVSHRNSGNGCPYCSGRNVIQGETDLATINPELAKEWHPTKNGTLTPMDVTSGSNKRAWWQCAKRHEWEATVSHRNSGNGCPYCSGRNVIQGETDLATINPELAKEWHPTKNATLTPVDVKRSSGKKVWWKCAKGHEWESTVNNRDRGNGCPYCTKIKQK